MKKDEKYFRGCLVGGAVGDAMGWPVEFLKYKEIVKNMARRASKIWTWATKTWPKSQMTHK